MKSFLPYDVSLGKRHQYITGSIGPRPICWASTINEKGQPNLAPYSFFNAFSANPPILVFSSNRRGRDNTTKDTLHNIKANKQVVINVVNKTLVNQMSISSTDYDSAINEFEKSGVTPIKSDIVKPFRVKESPAQFECTVKDIITLGDEGGAGNLFICQIEKIHISEEVLDENEFIDPYLMNLVGRLGGSYYVESNQKSIFSINNPFGKNNIGFDSLPEEIITSNWLTGNQIADLAILSEMPENSKIADYKNNNQLAKKSIETIHKEASILINETKTEEALLLLLAFHL